LSYHAQHERGQLLAKTWALRTKLESITAPVPYEEREAMKRAQFRFDNDVGAYTGHRAPEPVPGDDALSYRKRLLNPLAAASEKFKTSSFYMTDSPTLSVIENIVYADAVEAAKRNIPVGTLKEVKRIDGAGREISTYFGDPGVWLSPYMAQGATCRIDRDPPKKV
jgi:hypothetical protein